PSRCHSSPAGCARRRRRCPSPRSSRRRSTSGSASTRASSWCSSSACRSSGRRRCSRSGGSRCAPARAGWWCRAVASVFLWRRLVGAQVRSQLQYRVSFALDLTGAFLISFVDFLAVLVIFHNVPALGTWNVHEVALLYALSTVSFAFTDLLVGHLDLFPQKIR